MTTWYLSKLELLDEEISKYHVKNKLIKPACNNEIGIFIDGYIVPRLEYFNTLSKYTQTELVGILFKQHKLNFIKYIKGIFTVIIFFEEDYYIFNDRHNIKKFFIYKNRNKFIITNSLKFISNQKQLSFSNENAAFYCTLEHFVNGMTLFNGISFSKPASYLKVTKDNELNISKYWEPTELFNKDLNYYSYKEIADKWQRIVNNYVIYLTPSEVSLTLTGGNDSRMVLAGLLSQGIYPYTFTFGNPLSSDVIIAKKVAQEIGLKFNNYFVKEPTPEWFKTYSKKIIEIGNSVINIHRAHRYDAIEKEKLMNPNVEMIFTGLVGGEYIKEPAYNNITIPRIFDELMKQPSYSEKKELLINKLKEKGINYRKLNIEEILKKLSDIIEPYNEFSAVQKKFIFTFIYYSTVHHTQDPVIFNQAVKYIVNPFMDIDFLEILSSSNFWYVNKRKRIFDKIYHSYFLVKIIDLLYPALSGIPFAKKGEYTGEELLRQPFRYPLKRIYRNFIRRKRYQQNFPIGKWLYDFTKDELNNLHPFVKDLFIEDYLISTLDIIKNISTEEKWHCVTNAVNLSMNLKAYSNV